MKFRLPSLIFVSFIALFCLVGDAKAYNPAMYTPGDFPWYAEPHTDDPTLFREIEIQLCSIGIWEIWPGSAVDIGSGNAPLNAEILYSGTGGSPRPTGIDIRNDYGSGIYYFQSYNSSGCTGIDDEPFGVYSWAYFFVNSEGEISNQNLSTGNFIPTVPIGKNIHIVNPTYGTTTATTTFNVQINYKTPFSIDYRPTTTRHFSIVDAVDGSVDFTYNFTVPASSSENIQISVTATTTPGSKYIRAMYLDTEGGIYSEVDEVFFNVATNTYYIATGVLSPRDTPSDLSQIDCGLYDIGCQFQKAVTFLFVPSANVLDKFSNLWQTISNKKPFGYVTVTIQQLSNLDVSGSSAFDLGTIPFMDSLFTPFRTLLGGILWALFAIYFYQRRLVTLDI